MEIVTAEGRFILTSTDKNAILNVPEIKKRFSKIKDNRKHITFDEWRAVLDETGYEIRYA